MAQFAAELRFEDIPAEVIGRAKAIILDGLGCGLFAADVAWTRILVGTLHKLDPAEGCASVWGAATGHLRCMLSCSTAQWYRAMKSTMPTRPVFMLVP